MLKTLLFPIAVAAFIVLLILMGAFGLLVALSIISAVRWVFGLPGRRLARRAARRAESTPSEAPSPAPSEPAGS